MTPARLALAGAVLTPQIIAAIVGIWFPPDAPLVRLVVVGALLLTSALLLLACLWQRRTDRQATLNDARLRALLRSMQVNASPE